MRRLWSDQTAVGVQDWASARELPAVPGQEFIGPQPSLLQCAVEGALLNLRQNLRHDYCDKLCQTTATNRDDE